jgi:hypothetical protein
MEQLTLTEDLQLIGIHVSTFPQGIQEAFTRLMKTLGEGRVFYGVSWMDDNDRVVYYAMAACTGPGEEKSHQYDALTIAKGTYLTEALNDWMSKTDRIKEVFERLTAGRRPDRDHPCIEWYKSDKEMLCMVRV